ncbi:MAG TPA: choice-of-anchor tandem repeat GloVer-containing protein [Tepidisphaeraceae bacterium]|nr:choice-of-anchor tandem repeat GloVer-containing protein [Tepidisphaeraceae bacterium]
MPTRFEMEWIEPRLLFTSYTPVAITTLAPATNVAALTADPAGNIYIATANQLLLIPAGTTTPTELFLNGNPLNTPRGLVADPSGDVFGLMTIPGIPGNDAIFEISANTHTLTTIANLPGPAGDAGNNPLVLDSSGNIYGALANGGLYSKGSIFEISASTHTFQTLASFDGTSGQSPTGALARDSAGNLYGASLGGPASSDSSLTPGGTLFEIPANSNGSITTLHTFYGDSDYDRMIPTGSIAVDSNGTLYGSATDAMAAEQFTLTSNNTFKANFTGGDNDVEGWETTVGIPVVDPAGQYVCQAYNTGYDHGNTPPIDNLIRFNVATGDIQLFSATVEAGPAFDGAGKMYYVDNATLYEMTPFPADPHDPAVKSLTIDLPAASTIDVDQALPPITITLTNASGSAVPSDGTLIYASLIYTGTAPSPSPLSGATIVDTANGVATFTGLSFSDTGSYQLRFSTDSSLPLTKIVTINVVDPSTSTTTTPLPTAHLKFDAAILNTVVGKKLPSFQISYRSANGKILKTAAGTVILQQVGQPLSGTLRAKLINGVATFSNVTVLRKGNDAFFATLAGNTDITGQSSIFIIRPTPAAHLIFSQQPTTVDQDSPFNASVWLSDSYHDGLVGQVQLSILPANGNRHTWSTKTGGNGIATFSNLQINRPGWYRLLAKDGKLTAKSKWIHVL